MRKMKNFDEGIKGLRALLTRQHFRRVLEMPLGRA
jgi:hypothetical protein